MHTSLSPVSIHTLPFSFQTLAEVLLHPWPCCFEWGNCLAYVSLEMIRHIKPPSALKYHSPPVSKLTPIPCLISSWCHPFWPNLGQVKDKIISEKLPLSIRNGSVLKTKWSNAGATEYLKIVEQIYLFHW